MKKKIGIIILLILAVALLAACGQPASEEHVHSFGDWTITKNPSCTEAGEQERLCTCGEKQTQTIPAKGHQYDDWKTVKEATCIEPGEQERICVCGERQKQTIPAKGHQFGEWKTVKEATCTEPGEQERICVCGEKQTQPIAAGHKSGDWEIVTEPTCASAGLKHKVCSVCGEVTETENIPKNTDHVFGNTNVIKAATCTETGTEESICTVCGYKKTNTLAALGHDPDGKGVCRRCGAMFIQMTDKEKAAAENVETMTHSVSVYSDEIRINIYFKDSYGFGLETPAYVDVKIVNSNKTVYNKTLVLSSTSSYVSIDMAEVDPGIDCNGTIYYKVYNTGYFIFDECGKDTDSLPWTVTVELPKVPASYSYIRYDRTINSTCKVTKVSYIIKGDVLYFYINGEKTYDDDGNNYSDMCLIGWKLYDSDGYVIDDGTIGTSNLKTGEKFKDLETRVYGIKPGEKYKLVFSNKE